MICKNCGKEIPDTAKFCFSCGAITSGDQPQNPNPSVGAGNSSNTQYGVYSDVSQPFSNGPAPHAGFQTSNQPSQPFQQFQQPPVSSPFPSAYQTPQNTPSQGPSTPVNAAAPTPSTQPFSTEQTGAYSYYQQSTGTPSPKGSKSKTGLIIGLSVGGGVLLILIVVLIILFSGILGKGGNLPTLVYEDDTISYGMPFEDVEDMVSDIYLYDEDPIFAFSDDMGDTTLLIRDEETVAGWYIQDRNTELSSGLKVGDRYSKMEELYPQAEYSGSGSFDPDEDYTGEFYIYYGPSGNICTEDEYEDYVDDADDDEALAALKVMVIAIEDGRVLDIIFADELMYSDMQ